MNQRALIRRPYILAKPSADEIWINGTGSDGGVLNRVVLRHIVRVPPRGTASVYDVTTAVKAAASNMTEYLEHKLSHLGAEPERATSLHHVDPIVSVGGRSRDFTVVAYDPWIAVFDGDDEVVVVVESIGPPDLTLELCHSHLDDDGGLVLGD